MKNAFLFAWIHFLTISAFAQQFGLVTSLSDSVAETSGLIFIDGKLFTHNDSGGEAALYEIDTLTGNVVRKITIQNAMNVDWEDICTDDTHIYVADIGNNNGNRTDLKIYKIWISDFLSNNSVTAGIISFAYADQTNFDGTPFSTNFDAEALISYHDSLYIFTKNWGNQRTHIYSIPKTKATWVAQRVDSFDCQGLITGGQYNPLSDAVLLSGYTFSSPFIVELYNFSAPRFSNGTVNRYNISPPAGYSIQVEAVTAISKNEYLFSAEKSSDSSGVYYWKTQQPLSTGFTDHPKDLMYPNPVSKTVFITQSGMAVVRIFSINGQQLTESTQREIDVSELPAGVYIVQILDRSNKMIESSKLIIE